MALHDKEGSEQGVGVLLSNSCLAICQEAEQNGGMEGRFKREKVAFASRSGTKSRVHDFHFAEQEYPWPNGGRVLLSK